LWKEYREQRPIVITGLILALLMPFFLIAGASTMNREMDFNALADAMPLFLAFVMWPLLAAACGAATISGEIGDGTIGFLLSRPASRRNVWLVKVAVAALSFLAIIIGSLGVAAVFAALAPDDGRETVLHQVAMVKDYGIGEAFGMAFLLGGLALLFATAVFFSTFLSRAMTAAAAAVVTALGIISLSFIVWSRFDLIPRFVPGLVTLEFGTAAVLILVASLFVFGRGEMLSGRGVLRYAAFGLLAALAGLVVVCVPAFVAYSRLTPEDAVLLDPRIAPSRNAVLATAANEEGGSAQSWSVFLDGSGIRRLGPRLSGMPAMSPDGKWIAYLSQRGPLGLRADTVSLHALRSDGTGDRVIAAPLPVQLVPGMVDTIRFSPDASRIALGLFNDALVVASVDGGQPVFVEPEEIGLDFARIYGWTEDGREVVVGSPGWSRIDGTSILAVDPDTLETRPIFESPRKRAYIPDPPGSDEGLRFVPLALVADDEDDSSPGIEMMIVDVQTGEVVESYAARCGMGLDISNDFGRLVYGDCRSEDENDRRTRLHFHDLAEDGDLSTVELEGTVWSVHLSPNGEWATVQYSLFGPQHSMAASAVHVSGRVQPFEDGWSPLGWSGRTGVVLARHDKNRAVRQLAVADVETGAMRQVFP
jgi:ABC-type transport system involved in multi-copper enzyme maturation permease subunit